MGKLINALTFAQDYAGYFYATRLQKFIKQVYSIWVKSGSLSYLFAPTSVLKELSLETTNYANHEFIN